MDREEIMASYHAIKRANERLGLKVQAAEKEIRKAFLEGMESSEFSSREKEYLSGKEESGITVRVYKGSCYIFSEEGVCITVYDLPSWFGRKRFFDGKTKIRNPKEYYRHYGVIA